MAKPVARLSDVNTAGGAITSAVSTNVLVNGRPAAMIGSVIVPHFPYKKIHKVPTFITTGANSVLVNGRPLAHISSSTTCGHSIATGSGDVLVGSGGISVSAGADPYESPQAQQLARENGPAAIGLDQPPETTTTPEPVDCGGFLSTLTAEDYNKRLSPNYTLGDLSIRTRAGQHYIKAQHGLTVQNICCNLKEVAVNILQPMLIKYPGFTVNSGFRTAKNGSDHEKGMAVDLQWQGIAPSKLIEICEYAANTLGTWQVIYEKPPTSTYGWVHIAYNKGRTGPQPRLSWFGSRYYQGFLLQV
jgi:uncharacterized Zn-binding protein involved in type VI secretion